MTSLPLPFEEEATGGFIILLTACAPFSYESKGSAVGLMGAGTFGASRGLRFLAVLGIASESQISHASLSDGHCKGTVGSEAGDLSEPAVRRKSHELMTDRKSKR